MAFCINHRYAINQLLRIAFSYASDRLRGAWVRDALIAAHRLVRDDVHGLDPTRATALEIVKLMPAYSARETLYKHEWLEQHNNWADTAIHALRLDDDMQYEGMDYDSYTKSLYEKLGRCRLAEHQIAALTAGQREASKLYQQRSFFAADLFCEYGRPDISVQMIGAHLESVPDTIEKQPIRKWLETRRLVYSFEEAITSRRDDKRHDILNRVEELHNREASTTRITVFGHVIEGLHNKRVNDAALPDPVEVIRVRSALVEALVIIADGSRDPGPLESALARFRITIGSLSEGDVVWIFAELVESLTHAVRWTDAVWNAEQDAARHAEAARIRARACRRSFNADDQRLSVLHDAATKLEALENHDIPSRVACDLSAIPLPTRLTDLYRPSDRHRSSVSEPAEDSVPVVAILIRMQGEPVTRPTDVQPGALHQFEVEARVTEWPERADALEITFLSVHPREHLYASGIRFTRDELKQPLEIRVAGTRPPGDPPLKLTAQAAFSVDDSYMNARLAGNTTLEITTFDPDTATPLNMPATARRLKQMMCELSNALPTLDAGVRRDTRLLLEAIARFAHTILDDRLKQSDDVNERRFQQELQYFLQADPQIGARLDKHVGRAGGMTDLVLGNVVLELKVNKRSAISWQTACERYIGQATQYASADDRQVSLLAVLDTSPKRAPAGVMGNEMDWAYPETTSEQDPPFPSLVGVSVVRAGFPNPSDFSR